MNKELKVIFSEEAENIYEYFRLKSRFKKFEKTIFCAIDQKVELIKANYHYGNPIAKDKIPEEYIIRYGITNLFRVELPKYWRMLYTLKDGEEKVEIIAFVTDIIDHKQYDKKFGYRKK